MKNFLIVLVLLFTSSVLAQNPEEKASERIKSMKVAFISSELDLTYDESQLFWPLYNEYEKKIVTLRRQELGSLKNTTVKKEAAGAKVKYYLNIELLRYEARKAFVDELGKVISDEKIFKFLVAEKKFNTVLIEKFKERMNSKIKD